MSYQIQLASVATPEADLDVFPFMNRLRQESGEQPPSALLKRFHDKLTALFPDTPWSDCHFAGDTGRLTVDYRKQEVVPHVLYLAGELGLTVVDNQSGAVHRPPTYQVVLEGPAPGVALGEAANRLAALMQKPVTEMLALLSGGRRKIVKKGVLRAQAQYYVLALKERAGCQATMALEHDRVVHPEPPPPSAPPARPAAAGKAAAAPGVSLAPVDVRPAMPPRSRREPEPEPETCSLAGADPRLFMLADGLRLTVYATVLYLVTGYFFRDLAGWPKLLLALGVTALAMAAVYRLAKGAGSNIVMRILAMVLIIIPLANILVLLLMIRRGKVALRENEIGAGWFGAAYDDMVRLRGGDSGLLPSTMTGLLAALGVAGLIGAGKQAAEKYIDAALGSHPQPCAIVGIWESSKLGPNGRVVMRDDGNYSVLPLQGQEDKVKQEQGEWAVRNRSFVWQVPLADKPWMKVEHIETFKLSLDGQTLTIFEPRSMGLFTEWRRAGAMKSQRCGFN
ncbi:hypothetical protein [Pseudoduganella sp. R-43]|uniref:hypothetical protein n=1 Tax=Pseudoduganella sp. R-43 TaxID=3404063 RepID=UPI003CE8E78C